MEWLLFVGVLIASALLTGYVRRMALRWQIIDVPNERSSHTRPTPRSGGIGFVVTFLGGLTVLVISGTIPLPLYGALIAGGAITALSGYWDDRGDITPYKRLALHSAAAVIGVAMIGGMPPIDLGFTVINPGWFGDLLAVIGVVWMINLYNFMDGIDGIGASEAIFASAVAGLMLLGIANGLGWTSLILAAACLGFLLWNWSPALIFMGDVGSGFLGYTFGILALTSGHTAPRFLWVWLILLGVFIVDTLITLINRLRRGESWHRAHRSHAYQHATMRWKSHAWVTRIVLLINLIWLAPCALLIWSHRDLILPVSVVALLPLASLVVYLKAGIEAPNPELSAAMKVSERAT